MSADKPPEEIFKVVDHPLEGLVDEAGLERIEALTESAHNTPYDKLYELIVKKLTDDCTLADAVACYIGEDPNGSYIEREYDIPLAAKAALDAVWPEIERREHHYKVTLARLMNKLRAMAEDAEAQILD